MDGHQAVAEDAMTESRDHTDEASPAPEGSEPEGATVDSDRASPATESAQPDEIVPRQVVEAVLFSADTPMPPAKIAAVLGVGDARDVRGYVKELNEQYEVEGRTFRIEQIAGGYRMMTLPAFKTWLVKLHKSRQESKLTPAAMETLAIIAYKQPATRAEIESVRGVAVGDIVNRLREMNLVKIVGRAEDLGRPMLYGTTKRFLEVFGLPGLDALPQVESLSSAAAGLRVTSEPAAEEAEASSASSAASAEPEVEPPNTEAIGATTPEDQSTSDADPEPENDPPPANG